MSDEKKYVTFKDLRVAPKPSPPSTPSSPSTTSRPRTPSPASKPGIAPERDFVRVPNSTHRDAMPGRAFRGKSKQVWDYLWGVSRGAVVPSRTVRKSRKEILKGSGLGSLVTVDAAVEHLQRVGLLAVRPAVGSLSGNEYEVFTYEEAATRTPSSTSIASRAHNLVGLDEPESSTTRATQGIDFKEQTEPPKTSFKDKEINTDDEAAPLRRAFFEAFERASKDITGQGIRSNESPKWADLAEVLVIELRIAAGRTTVSSVPAFLAEHLRRRLWKREKRELEAEAQQEAKNVSTGLQTPGIDISKCPDCGGTKMRYVGPGPFEGPVTRCRHERLTREAGQ